MSTIEGPVWSGLGKCQNCGIKYRHYDVACPRCFAYWGDEQSKADRGGERDPLIVEGYDNCGCKRCGWNGKYKELVCPSCHSDPSKPSGDKAWDSFEKESMYSTDDKCDFCRKRTDDLRNPPWGEPWQLACRNCMGDPEGWDEIEKESSTWWRIGGEIANEPHEPVPEESPVHAWRFISVHKPITDEYDGHWHMQNQRGDHLFGPDADRSECSTFNYPTSKSHTSPDPHCSCGWYSQKPNSIANNCYKSQGSMLAQIDLWGRMLEGHKAYRSQFARVKRLWPHSSMDLSPRDRQEIEQQLGVPVDGQPWDRLPNHRDLEHFTQEYNEGLGDSFEKEASVDIDPKMLDHIEKFHGIGTDDLSTLSRTLDAGWEKDTIGTLKDWLEKTHREDHEKFPDPDEDEWRMLGGTYHPPHELKTMGWDDFGKEASKKREELLKHFYEGHGYGPNQSHSNAGMWMDLASAEIPELIAIHDEEHHDERCCDTHFPYPDHDPHDLKAGESAWEGFGREASRERVKALDHIRDSHYGEMSGYGHPSTPTYEDLEMLAQMNDKELKSHHLYLHDPKQYGDLGDLAGERPPSHSHKDRGPLIEGQDWEEFGKEGSHLHREVLNYPRVENMSGDEMMNHLIEDHDLDQEEARQWHGGDDNPFVWHKYDHQENGPEGTYFRYPHVHTTEPEAWDEFNKESAKIPEEYFDCPKCGSKGSNEDGYCFECNSEIPSPRDLHTRDQKRKLDWVGFE